VNDQRKKLNLIDVVLGGNLIYAVMAGGVFMLLAAAFTLRVRTGTPAPKPADEIPALA
jgi:hypothetical protein